MALLCVTVLQGVGKCWLLAGNPWWLTTVVMADNSAKVDAWCLCRPVWRISIDLWWWWGVFSCASAGRIDRDGIWKLRQMYEVGGLTDVQLLSSRIAMLGILFAYILFVCQKSVLLRDTRCSLLSIPNQSYQRFCTMLIWQENGGEIRYESRVRVTSLTSIKKAFLWLPCRLWACVLLWFIRSMIIYNPKRILSHEFVVPT